MQIEGLTKKVTFKEAQRAIEDGESIVGIVAIRPLDLLDINREEYWDLLESEVVDGIILEKDSMDEKILEYNKEHDVLLIEVEIWASDIEPKESDKISNIFKDFLIEKRESNKDLNWLKKEISKIIEEHTFKNSEWKDKIIDTIQITVYMEDEDYVKDVILVDTENKEYFANRCLYRKLENLYQVFLFDLLDMEVCEKLNEGFKLTI